MIQMSTPLSESLVDGNVHSEVPSEELNEEDQVFLASIHDDLNKIVKKPRTATLKAIMNFSQSL
jgi:hypothetical protein